MRAVNFEVRVFDNDIESALKKRKRELSAVKQELRSRREPRKAIRKRVKFLRCERRRLIAEAKRQAFFKSIENRKFLKNRAKNAPPAHPAPVQAGREAA